MKVIKKVCRVCGEEFRADTARRKLCEVCREKNKKLRERKNKAQYKKPGAEKPKPKKIEKPVIERIDNKPCRTCDYGGRLDGCVVICDYISLTGKMRPCPPPPECTCYKEKDGQTKRTAMSLKITGAAENGEYSAYVSGKTIEHDRYRYSHKRR